MKTETTTEYQLVHDDAGAGPFASVMFPTVEALTEALATRGCTRRSDGVGGDHLREELRGQPIFDGVCGPMWGGDGPRGPIVRYETWSVYEVMSR